VFGSATLVLAAIFLRAVRRYVDLAEERMELLRQGQARLLSLTAEGRRVPEGRETPEQELEELREARRKIPVPAAAGISEAPGGSRGPEGRGREDGVIPPMAFPETSTARKKPAADGGSTSDERPRLGVRHPHPDDGVDLAARAPSKPSGPSGPASARSGARSGASLEMFRKHYDKYLENYAGYVELAEHLHRAGDEAEAASLSSERRDREERLGRVNDGISRTIARLDMLEGLNPALAADDRISRRASIARRHAELGV
jgi:hypothetical protein